MKWNRFSQSFSVKQCQADTSWLYKKVLLLSVREFRFACFRISSTDSSEMWCSPTVPSNVTVFSNGDTFSVWAEDGILACSATFMAAIAASKFLIWTALTRLSSRPYSFDSDRTSDILSCFKSFITSSVGDSCILKIEWRWLIHGRWNTCCRQTICAGKTSRKSTKIISAQLFLKFYPKLAFFSLKGAESRPYWKPSLEALTAQNREDVFRQVLNSW